MTACRHAIAALAERLIRLSDGYRDDVAVVVEEAWQAQVDPAALRRLVAWMRLDAVQRAEREALDDQYRFLAGELSQPAELPIEGELANAARLYASIKIGFYGYDAAGNRGVGCGLNGVWITRRP